MTTPPSQAQAREATKSDPSGPAGALVALKRAAKVARKIAKRTQTEVVTVSNSSVAKQLNVLAKH